MFEVARRAHIIVITTVWVSLRLPCIVFRKKKEKKCEPIYIWLWLHPANLIDSPASVWARAFVDNNYRRFD